MSGTLETLIAALSPEKRAALADMVRPHRDPIAIVGLGCRLPGSAASPDEFWRLLVDGVDAVGPVPGTRWDSASYFDPDPAAPGKMYTRWGGFVPDLDAFDARFFGLGAAEAVRMDPQQRLLLETAWEAIESAGESAERLAGTRTGVFVGIVPDEYGLRQYAAEGTRCFDDPYLSAGCASSMAAGRLSYLLDLRGPNLSVDTACSSALVAIHLACRSLAAHECDAALAGGVNAIVAPEVFVQLCKMGMLARDGRTKSFAADADGFAVGEGCGLLLLKRLSDATRDHNSIVAIVRGSAVNEDGRSASMTAPSQEAQAAVIRAALSDARVNPEDISYIEAHGSGTSLGDPIEVEALAAVFGRQPSDRPIFIGSVKTNLGHLAAAAGAAGVIKTALALQRRRIPPSLHFRTPNPRIPWASLPFSVPTEPVEWEPRRGARLAGVSSFGWAGTNAHVVLEEAPEHARTVSSGRPPVLVLSAKTDSALDAATERLRVYLRERDGDVLSDAAFTLAVGRSHFDRRRVVVRRGGTLVPLPAEEFARRRKAVFVIDASVPVAAEVAGALYAHEPTFRQDIDACAAAVLKITGQDVRRFSPAEAGRGQDAAAAGVRDVVVRWAVARMWMRWGISPAGIHAFGAGALVAAALRGAVTIEEAVRIAATGATTDIRAAERQQFETDLLGVVERTDHVLLEIGSNSTTASRSEPQRRRCVSGALGSGPRTAADGIGETLARLWLMGLPVDWDAYYSGEARLRIPLPTYPFERQRYWTDHSASHSADLDTLPRQEMDRWFYMPAWREAAPLDAADLREPVGWLLFCDESGVCDRLASWLRRAGQEVVAVREGEAFERGADGTYSVAADSRQDYDALLHDILNRAFHPHHIVHAWTLGTPRGSCDDGHVSEEEINRGFYGLIHLAQALGNRGLGSRIAVLASHVQQVTDGDRIVPERATALGVCHVLPFEDAALSVRHIDVDFPCRVPIEQLAGEIAFGQEKVVALRGRRRWAQVFEQVPARRPDGDAPLRRGGVYLISGGLGGIALSIAEHLVDTLSARLVLLARTLHPHGLERVRALEARGAEVLVVQGDVCSVSDVGAAVTAAIGRFGALHGVFHMAGVPGAGLIALKTADAAARVLAPKVQGTAALVKALGDHPLDLLVLFSSVASVSGGGAGQADYAAANAFLDAYARARFDTLNARSIAWGEWQWNAWQSAMSGMDPEKRAFFETQRRRFGIHASEGGDALRRALACPLPNVIVSTQHFESVLEWLRSHGQSAFGNPPAPERATFPRPTIGTSFVSAGTGLEETIATVWKEMLRLDRVGVHDNFFELGGNSLIGVNVMARIRKRLGIDNLPAHLLYEAPSIAAMANLLGGGRRDGRLDESDRHGAQRRAAQLRRRRAR